MTSPAPASGTAPRQSLRTEILADLAAEGDQLEALVAGLTDSQWRAQTPAEGWDVATQIAHLAWTDEAAVIAATDKEAWDAGILEALEDVARSVGLRRSSVASAARSRSTSTARPRSKWSCTV